jgi:hypothetical protein
VFSDILGGAGVRMAGNQRGAAAPAAGVRRTG